MKTGGYAEGRISKETSRVFNVHPRHIVRYGPYKRKKTALQKMRELRDPRCATIKEIDGQWIAKEGGGWESVDHGPAYSPSSVRHFFHTEAAAP